MRKRRINGTALRTIRELKAASDPRYKGSQFAIACLMSHAHLINIEKGRKFPADDVIERIAERLEVPVDAISHEMPTAGSVAA